MVNQLLSKIEASDFEGVSQLIKKGTIKDDQAWTVHLSLFPLVQRVLNPPYINPHLPKMYSIYREFLSYLNREEILLLVMLEINEYTRRPKAKEIPKTSHLHLSVSFPDIETAIKEGEKENAAALLYSFLELKGKAELARNLLLLGSGSLGQSLGHSISCTAFILLEMLERPDQDSWPVLASLADYFCQGWFHTMPALHEAYLPSKETLTQHLLRATTGSSIVDLHHTITLYSIERVRYLLSEAEYAHMIASWIEFMGTKSAKLPPLDSTVEKMDDYAGFYQYFSQQMKKPILSFPRETISSPEGRLQLGRYFIKGVSDLYQGDYDPHFMTGLGSALRVMNNYWDQVPLAMNALRQYLVPKQARI